MTKLDLKKDLASLYNPSAKQASIVEVPPMNFLMIDGEGDPNTAVAYQTAVSALYTMSYTLKFMVKKGPLGIDYAVMALEGLWWVDDLSQFSYDDRRHWRWTMMIRQPDMITPDMVAATRQEVIKKKGLDLSGLRFETFAEGRAAQIMHIGPYSAEPPTIERLHEFVTASGYRLRGKHHEIYLGDPNRTAPEKLKTILRHPIEPLVQPGRAPDGYSLVGRGKGVGF